MKNRGKKLTIKLRKPIKPGIQTRLGTVHSPPDVFHEITKKSLIYQIKRLSILKNNICTDVY